MLAERFSSPACTGIKVWEKSPAREMSKRGAMWRAAPLAKPHICSLLHHASIPRAERGAEREGETSERLSGPPAWVSRVNADPLEGLVSGRGDPCCKPPVSGLAAGAGGCWDKAWERSRAPAGREGSQVATVWGPPWLLQEDGGLLRVITAPMPWSCWVRSKAWGGG